jgi:hypothetical protein
VEQYLEEMARQVHDSTQRLTDNIDSAFEAAPHADSLSQPPHHLNHSQPSLSRNLSASSDRIFSQVQLFEMNFCYDFCLDFCNCLLSTLEDCTVV